MGIFVNYPSNIFSGLKDIPQTIINADTHPLWVTSIIICNRGTQPLRFNLQKVRLQGLELEKSCNLASTTNLNVTYFNGTNGLGATLTNGGTLAAFSIDGVSPPINSRILIKNQTSTFQNGIYVLTVVGDNATAWVLTRASDYDTIIEIENGDVITVTSGTTNINTKWNQNSVVTIIGTSPITFIPIVPSSIFYINELEIKSYTTVDIIDITGVLNLQYSIEPYVSDKLVCFTNGYTQKFDCEVVYAQLNELPNI